MNDIGISTRKPDPVTRARALGPAIAAVVGEIEARQDFPEPLITELHESRLFRLLLPRSVGGEEVEPWVYVAAIEEIARHDGSLGWNMFVANSSALIAPFVPFEAARTIYGDPRGLISWGPPNQHKLVAAPGGYRVNRRMALLVGLPPGHLDRRARPRREPTAPAPQPLRPADRAHGADAQGRDDADPRLAHARHARHRVGGLLLRRCLRARDLPGTREDPTLRRDRGPLYAFTMQGLYACGVAAVALGIARAMLDAFIDLAATKTPRYLARLADNPSVQSDVARREADIGSARAWLVEILKDVHGRADEVEPIDTTDRARVRLACTQAIHQAEKTADWVYKAAGTSAIFLGTPFERRFRDIHTLSQQIQAREAHFETVGRILFNGDPDGTFM